MLAVWTRATWNFICLISTLITMYGISCVYIFIHKVLRSLLCVLFRKKKKTASSIKWKVYLSNKIVFCVIWASLFAVQLLNQYHCLYFEIWLHMLAVPVFYIFFAAVYCTNAICMFLNRMDLFFYVWCLGKKRWDEYVILTAYILSDHLQCIYELS